MEVRIRPWQCRPAAHVLFCVVFLVGIQSSVGWSRLDSGNVYVGNGEGLRQTARSSSITRSLSEIQIPGEFLDGEAPHLVSVKCAKSALFECYAFSRCIVN
jgi:hypothetical protein